MANIGVVLKAEISRLARKEVRGEIESLKKASTSYRREIAELKRRVATLDRSLKAATKSRAAAASPEAKTAASFRFSAKGLSSLRAKLGLSAADFGRLAGVSALTIYHWEQGKTTPRSSQLPKLAALRGIGKREAMARLEGMN